MYIKQTETLIVGFQFAEGLRWKNGELWFCDLQAKKIYRVNQKQELICHVTLEDSPACIGWLSDDRMLVTSLYNRKVLCIEAKGISEYADLSSVAPGYGHDMFVGSDDRLYISTSGFYPSHGVIPVKSDIIMVSPSGELSSAAQQVGYPNGLALINKGRQMVVSETFAANIALFDVDVNGTLKNKRSFYSFDNNGFQVTFNENGVPDDLTRYYPDGLDYDEPRDMVWVASPGKNEVLGIQNNKMMFKIKTKGIAFDCTIGGDKNDTLYIGTAQPSSKGWTGHIESVKINE